MKAIIIEDEKLAAERLSSIIKEVDNSIEIIAKLTSVKDSIKWLQNNKIDLIFLDIQLTDGLSFSIFEEVEAESPIIFTTAYDEYAIKAFKLNSIDYLLKPIRKDELEQALNKFKRVNNNSSIIDFRELLKTMRGEESSYKKRFLIQFGEKIKKIETEDVSYFYALEKSNFLTTKDNQTYPIDYTLDKLQELLDPDKFFRINRKMIINFNSIKNMVALSRSRIKIDLTPHPIKELDPIVSIERASDFKEWLDK